MRGHLTVIIYLQNWSFLKPHINLKKKQNDKADGKNPDDDEVHDVENEELTFQDIQKYCPWNQLQPIAPVQQNKEEIINTICSLYNKSKNSWKKIVQDPKLNKQPEVIPKISSSKQNQQHQLNKDIQEVIPEVSTSYKKKKSSIDTLEKQILGMANEVLKGTEESIIKSSTDHKANENNEYLLPIQQALSLLNKNDLFECVEGVLDIIDSFIALGIFYFIIHIL